MSKILFVLLGIGAIIFLSSGGLQKARGFTESLGLKGSSEESPEEIFSNPEGVTDSSNKNETIDAVANLSDDQKQRLQSSQESLNTSLLGLQKEIDQANQDQRQAVAKTLALSDIIKDSKNLEEVISIQNSIISKNFGEGAKFAINEKRRQDQQIKQVKAKNFATAIASSGLTDQEKADIKALDERRARKDTLTQKKKRTGVDTVTLKRIEEERAAKALGLNNFVTNIRGKHGRAKAFANPNFDLGLASTATQADRDRAIKQQQDRKAQLAKAEANKKRQQQREKTGASIRSQEGITQSNAKAVLASKGIKLNTSSLSNKTLAILRERGLI